MSLFCQKKKKITRLQDFVSDMKSYENFPTFKKMFKRRRTTLTKLKPVTDEVIWSVS